MPRHVTFGTDGTPSVHLGLEYAHPNVISGGDSARIEYLGTFLDNIQEEFIGPRKAHRVIHGTYKGIPITAFSTGMGPSSVSITLPEIIEACDDPDMNILRLGTAGALQPYLKKGDYLVSTSIDRQESASEKVVMNPDFVAVPDDVVRKELEAQARKYIPEGFDVHSGQTIVTDELYFYNRYLRELENHGDNIGVSMEFSMYCALRDQYNLELNKNIKAGNLLRVSDLVVKPDKPQDEQIYATNEQNIIDAQIRAGLETLVALRNN